MRRWAVMGTTGLASCAAALIAVVGIGAGVSNAAPRAPELQGYWLAGPSGIVTAVGKAVSYGSPASRLGHAPTSQVVGIASTGDGKGYWVASAAGTVWAFGDAKPEGSLATAPASPVVGIAGDGESGYWMVSADGAVYAFGTAHNYGGMNDLKAPRRLAAPIVGIAPTVSGHGYWLAGGDGGVFSFGDARFHGSLPKLFASTHQQLAAPIVGVASSPAIDGYWLLGRDGGVFAFGRALFHGSLPEYLSQYSAPASDRAPATGLAGTPDGGGYWLELSTGHIYGFNDAAKYPSQVPGEYWGEYDSIAAMA